MNTQATPGSAPVEILVAGASPTQAQRLQYLLEQQGYHVTVALNGHEAFAAGQRCRPALVISEIIMPEMDGCELCLRIKADAALALTPVILITTLSDPEDVIRGLECGADDFILRPYDEGELLRRVRFALRNGGMRPAGRSDPGVEIFFNERKHLITADRPQILNLLLSTYAAAIQRNRELSRAQEELLQVNGQITAANQELDAFSFSVSHDLQAPLREVATFAQLLEHSAPGLDAQTRRIIQGITGGITRMTRLIGDLLSFARAARQDMVRCAVDLDHLFRDVIAELQQGLAERRIEWSVAALPTVPGDAAMLRQVAINLLSNAVKYSRKCPVAVIEVGVMPALDGEVIIYVRDNGAGFEMAAAARLFGVFQRLHHEADFEGTGVGLATVRRIITRHGGRIWAEGVVSEGATFYFSLPPRG